MNQLGVKAMTTKSRDKLVEAFRRELRRRFDTYTDKMPFDTVNGIANDLYELIESNRGDGLIDVLKGQLKEVIKISDEAGVIGMIGSYAWKAQMKRLINRGDGWVSVEDRLPEYGDRYLVLLSSGQVHIATWVKAYWSIGINTTDNATHWQPLPQPPTKEE